MEETIRLGRIAGIRVGANWSVLAIVALLVLSLAGTAFPSQFPGLDPAAYLAAAAAAALLFLASLLAHELAHAVVARRAGLRVEGITFWLFGGVARLAGDAPTAGTDLRIAAVGPLVSLALGGLFGAATAGLRAVDAPAITAGATRWLALINVSLGLFNLLPGAPLDGGRVLRAVVWWRTGDRYRATRTAARAGRLLGMVLIGLGVLQFLTGGLGGLWLAFVGWFLVGAARAEEQSAVMRGALTGVRVGEVMTPDPVTAPAGMTVRQFLDDWLPRTRFSSLPIVNPAGRVDGLVTLRRIREVPPAQWATTRIADIACPPGEILTAAPGDPLLGLLEALPGCADGRALVIDRGRLVGIVSPTDIARAAQAIALTRPDLLTGSRSR
jgi:Zn-dependent protease/CBS domain-containing protein